MRLLLVAVPVLLSRHLLPAQPPAPFQVDETTIAQIQAAFRDGSLTCRSLVEQYLKRIDAHDKRGAALNAIVMTNDQALKTADDLDRRFRQSGPVGRDALRAGPGEGQLRNRRHADDGGLVVAAGHDDGQGRLRRQATARRRRGDAREVEHGGVRVQSHRNRQFDSAGLHAQPVRHAAASPPDRAAARRPAPLRTLRRSGWRAIPATRSAGRRPIRRWSACDRRWASSAAAASCRSISPPTSPARVTRTVADTAAVLQVIAGEDPNDPATAASRGQVDANYAAALRRRRPEGRAPWRPASGLRHADARRGSRRRVSRRARRVAESRRRGDRSRWPSLSSMRLRATQGGGCNQFKFDLNRYPGVRSATRRRCTRSTEIIKSRRFHPSIQARLESSQASDDVPGETAGCKAATHSARSCAPRCSTLMDRPAARRAGLSDLEQSAAPDRRPQHAGRRQQPVLLAEHRVSGDHRADGISRAAIRCPPASSSSDGRGARRRSSAWRTRYEQATHHRTSAAGRLESATRLSLAEFVRE